MAKSKVDSGKPQEDDSAKLCIKCNVAEVETLNYGGVCLLCEIENQMADPIPARKESS